MAQAQRYQRQITLPEIGEIGQQKLNEAKVLVAGCGGLGSVAAVYLAASGIGHLHLVDFDVISLSNLHRQVFYKTSAIGKAKAEVLAAHINAVNPDIKVTFSKVALTKANVFSLIANFDIILDCTDSLPIKYLMNDACVLADKILVYGSLYKFDGYVATFNAPDGTENRTANLRDAFPQMPKKYIPNCAEAGTLNAIVGLIGLMQANEVLKLVCEIGVPIQNQLLIYNSLFNSQFKMKLEPSFDKEHIKLLFEKEPYADVSCNLQDETLLILASALKLQLLNSRAQLYLISVIENLNTPLPFEVDARIPLSKFKPSDLKIDPLKSYILICQRGITSYTATLRFKEVYKKVVALSLKGGIENYSN